MRKFRLIVVCMLGCALATNAQTTKIPLALNGSVNAVVQKGDTIYIGGSFTMAGQQDSVGANGGAVDFNTAKHFSHWPKPNDVVNVVIGDGSGGFYIGGSFTMVGTQPRNGVAHINASGALTAQLTGLTFNNSVMSLAFKGNTLYIGGAYTSVGDNSNANMTRNRLSAVNVLTSQFTSWDPNANNFCGALAIKNDSIYAGGAFTQVGGATHNYLARISLTTGITAAWEPAVNGEVMVLALYGDTLFAGGRFTSINGLVRNRIAALKDTTLLAWNPDADNQVRAIAVSNSTVYLGGIFTTMGGLPRVALASADRLSGGVNPWNAASAATVINSMVLRNNVIYASGNFVNKSIGGLVRTSIVALDVNLDTLMALPWNPNVPEGAVNTIAVSGNTNMLYMGGIFSRLGSVTRNRLAAFRSSTGELLAWNPDADNTVTLLAVSKKLNRIYAAGPALGMINGNTATRLGAVDANTGSSVMGWSPVPSAQIAAMVSTDSVLYIAGTFTSVTVAAVTTTRNRLAAIDHAGSVTAWNPVPTSTVNCIIVKGDTVYVGGAFTSAGGQPRNRVAALNTTTGTAFNWAPNVAGTGATVTSIAVKDNVVYMGGAFTTIGGISRLRLGAVDATSAATLLPWDPRVSSTPTFMNIVDNGVYIGGPFTLMGAGLATSRPYLAAVDATPTNGVISGWMPAGVPVQAPTAMVYANNNFYVGYSSPPYFYTLTKDQSLPVTFAAIHATKQGKDVKINWSTASEKNNHYFEVERSSDGKQFTAISGSIKGAGNSNAIRNYSFTDRDVFTRVNTKIYYRIRQVDFDGQSDYSAIVSAGNDETALQVALYPNPAKGAFTLSFADESSKQVEVYDMQGQLILSRVSESTQQYIDLGPAKKGIYMVRVKSGSKQQTAKLIIE